MAKKVAGKAAENKTVGTSFLKRNLYPLIVFAFSFLLFANSIPNDYNMDDEIVTRNHRLTSQGISAIPEIFTSSYYQDDMGYAYEYRPLVLTSFAIEHQFFGESPHVGHFINVTLYALTCSLLYLLLIQLSALFSPFFALAVVLLFAAHTSHTEVVSSIKNRDEILGLLFGLLALITSVKAVHKKKPVLILLLPVFYVMALLSKITFFPFAFIIVASLALFTDIKLIRLLLVSILLAIPAFILLPVAHLVPKILMTLALPLGSLLLYAFLHVTFNTERVKPWLQQFKTKILAAVSAATLVPHAPSVSNFKWSRIISESVPPAAYFSVQAIIIPLLLAGIYAAGYYFWHPVISALALCALLLIGLSKNEKLVWWSRLALYICIAVFPRAVYTNEGGLPLHIGVIILILGYDVFSGRKYYLPALLLLFLFLIHLLTVLVIYYNPLPPAKDPMISGLFLLLLFMYAAWQFLNNRKYVMAGLALAALAGNIILSVKELSPMWGPWFILIFLVMAAMRFKPQSIPYWLWLGKAGVIALMIFMQETAPPVQIDYKTGLNNTVGQIEKVASENKTTVLPQNQDRPIAFVEQPVSPADSWQIRTGTSLRVMFHYFTKVIMPYPLAFYYGYKFIEPQKITEPVPLISLAVHLLLVLAAIYFIRKNKLISLGIAIYLISVVTFANYFLPVPGILGDRYLLLASLGWSILLALIIFKIFKVNTDTGNVNFANAPKGLKYTLVACIALYSLLTFARNLDWKNDLTLMRKDVQYVSMSSQANNLLAIHLMQNAEKEVNPAQQTELRKEALTHFKKALEIYPPFFNVAFDIGRTYASLNNTDSALVYFMQAARMDTTFIVSHQYAAEILIGMKRWDEAIPYTRHFIQMAPKEYEGYAKLSYIYFAKADYNQSIAVNKQAIGQMPANVNPLINIAQVYRTLQQPDSALYYLNLARQIEPANPTVNQAIGEMSR